MNQARRYSSFTRQGQQSRDSIIRSYGEQIRAREQGTLDEFKRAIAALAARSGKRVLVYVSNGLELHPGQTFSQSLGSSLLNQWDETVVREYEAAIAEANKSGVTIHSLDARGLTTDVDASESEPAALDKFLYDANRREVLAGFADATGGVLVENRNSFKTALDTIYQASSTYYSLGVTLSNLDPKKKDHAIDVRTTRPGVKLEARRSWSARTAEDAARSRMEMALVTPDAAGEFPVLIQTGPPTKKDAGIGRRLVPVEVKIPLSGADVPRRNRQEEGRRRHFDRGRGRHRREVEARTGPSDHPPRLGRAREEARRRLDLRNEGEIPHGQPAIRRDGEGRRHEPDRGGVGQHQGGVAGSYFFARLATDALTLAVPAQPSRDLSPAIFQNVSRGNAVIGAIDVMGGRLDPNLRWKRPVVVVLLERHPAQFLEHLETALSGPFDLHVP